MNEITNINELEVGSVYASCWKDHELEFRNNQLDYLSVLGVSCDTKSGELVKTKGGNRVFSKLRWFGPLADTLDDLIALKNSTYNNQIKQSRAIKATFSLVPCHLCGCTGLHACMGQPIDNEPWTTDRHRRFESAMSRVRELRKDVEAMRTAK